MFFCKLKCSPFGFTNGEHFLLYSISRIISEFFIKKGLKGEINKIARKQICYNLDFNDYNSSTGELRRPVKQDGKSPESDDKISIAEDITEKGVNLAGIGG